MIPEIVITIGLPGSAKSTAVKPLIAKGYTRINRDLIGGALDKTDCLIYRELRRLFSQGVRSFVLDNCYTFPQHREVLFKVAAEVGLPVRALVMQTTFEQCQLFAARRQYQTFGRVLSIEDYDLPEVKGQPNMFPPIVQYTFNKGYVSPTLAEGFTRIDLVPVETVWGPEYLNKALIIDLDGTVRLTPDEKACPWPRNVGEVIVKPETAAVIQRYKDEGYLILAATNQSGVSRKATDKKYVSPENVVACIEATAEKLGVEFDAYLYATDRGGPPRSFWRKPHVGMGIEFIERYKLDPAQCLMVGDATSDKTFAARCGFQFSWAKDFR